MTNSTEGPSSIQRQSYRQAKRLPSSRHHLPHLSRDGCNHVWPMLVSTHPKAFSPPPGRSPNHRVTRQRTDHCAPRAAIGREQKRAPRTPPSRDGGNSWVTRTRWPFGCPSRAPAAAGVARRSSAPRRGGEAPRRVEQPEREPNGGRQAEFEPSSRFKTQDRID